MPQLLAGLPGSQGIHCISTGSRAAAAVTDEGDVYMWGRLMAEDNARQACSPCVYMCMTLMAEDNARQTCSPCDYMCIPCVYMCICLMAEDIAR